eukprot:1159965-Pelagomonas_calceolata.AAC.23
MFVLDEIKDYSRYTSLTFIDFLEALGRAADMKSLPNPEDLEAAASRQGCGEGTLHTGFGLNHAPHGAISINSGFWKVCTSFMPLPRATRALLLETCWICKHDKTLVTALDNCTWRFMPDRIAGACAGYSNILDWAFDKERLEGNPEGSGESSIMRESHQLPKVHLCFLFLRH